MLIAAGQGAKHFLLVFLSTRELVDLAPLGLRQALSTQPASSSCMLRGAYMQFRGAEVDSQVKTTGRGCRLGSS